MYLYVGGYSIYKKIFVCRRTVRSSSHRGKINAFLNEECCFCCLPVLNGCTGALTPSILCTVNEINPAGSTALFLTVSSSLLLSIPPRVYVAL